MQRTCVHMHWNQQLLDYSILLVQNRALAPFIFKKRHIEGILLSNRNA
jgi:hypothetical protein